jgi:hypothetical protein
MILLNIFLLFLLFSTIYFYCYSSSSTRPHQAMGSKTETCIHCAVIICAVLCVIVLAWYWGHIFLLNAQVSAHLSPCIRQTVLCYGNHTKVIILMIRYVIVHFCVYTMTLLFITQRFIELSATYPAHCNLIKYAFWFALGLLFLGFLLLNYQFYILPNVRGTTTGLALGVLVFLL